MHRDGPAHPDATGRLSRIRRSHPAYGGLTDREVLTADFALHDAQRVIAMELGFGSWAEL
jgi:hypothetical protein